MTPFETPFDAKSAEILERAVATLGNTPLAREVVTKVYVLGKIDGTAQQIEARTKALDQIIGTIPA